MKKKLSILMMVVVMLMCDNVYASSACSEKEKLYNRVYEEYEDDSEFMRMRDEMGESYASEFIWNVVANTYSAYSTFGGGGNECYQFVSNIKQTKTYNCGSTTTLQTLYGLSSASKVSGNTDSAKIATLDAEYNVDSQGSMYVYQVRDALNKYNTGNQTYIYKQGSSMTLAGFEEAIANSLTYCKPVVLHARTEYLSYYGGKKSGHYISVDYINRTTDKVRLVDCNYNASYYGVHSNVSLSEAYNCISAVSGRYLIY